MRDNSKAVKIDLSHEAIDFKDEKSNSSFKDIGEKLVNEEEVAAVLKNVMIKAESFIDDSTIILSSKSLKNMTEYSLKNEWEGLRSEKQYFQGQLKCLNPDQMLTNFVIEDALKALICRFRMSNFVSYLMETSIYSVLKNMNDSIINEIYRKELLNKKLIFILIKSVHYPFKLQWFVTMIEMKNKRIFILDSLPARMMIKKFQLHFIQFSKLFNCYILQEKKWYLIKMNGNY